MIQQFHKWVCIQMKWNQHVKETITFCVHCSSVHNSQEMEKTEVSINWKIKKWGAYVLFSQKKEWNHPVICSNIKRSGDHYVSEISQIQKDKYKWCHTQAESKIKVDFTDIKSRMVAIRVGMRWAKVDQWAWSMVRQEQEVLVCYCTVG
jgi:hypothetical protein